jgi:hypothetical protein
MTAMRVCAAQYGKDFDTATAVGQLTAYLDAVYAMYGKPLWLTEFALTDYPDNPSDAPTYPSFAQQAAFMNAIVPVLEGLPYLERFAWFSLPQEQVYSGDTAGLYFNNGSCTPTGCAYRAF